MTLRTSSSWQLRPCVLAVAGLALACVAIPPTLASGETLHWIDELRFPAPMAADWEHTEFVKFGLDAAPWVAAAVAARADERGDRPEARQVALLRGAGERAYLAVNWDGLDGRYVEVLAVSSSPGAPNSEVPPLRQVRELTDDYVQIVAPTGTQPFPDEPPVLAIWHAGEAGGAIGSTRIILLTGDTIDITPDWAGRTLGMRDLDGDGIAEIVAFDETWHGFPGYCGACGPHVVVILRRTAHRTDFACTAFPDLYRQLADHPDDAEDWYQLLAQRANLALINAQAGRFTEALGAAQALLETAKIQDRFESQILNGAESIAQYVARAAAESIGSACPLSAVTPRYRWVPWWVDRPVH